VHPNGDAADTGPRIEPGAQRPECSVVGRAGKPGEAERRYEQPTTLIGHALFDDIFTFNSATNRLSALFRFRTGHTQEGPPKEPPHPIPRGSAR
jgi:hypothetical protein